MPGLVGIITRDLSADVARLRLARMMQGMMHEPYYVHGAYCLPDEGCYLGWVGHPNSFDDCNPTVDPTGDRVLIFTGEHLGHDDSSAPGRSGADRRDATRLLRRYEAMGERLLSELNGWFAGVLVDVREHAVRLFNDRFGVSRVYYHEDAESFAFASEAKSLLSIYPDSRALDARALGEFLGCGTVLQDRSLFANLKVLPGGSCWTFRGASLVAKRRYFEVGSWEKQPILAEDAFFEKLRTTVARVLPSYFSSRSAVGVSLTGGLDTRVIMAGRPASAAPTVCYTYGGMYRDCFDVQIAKDVARACRQEHRVLPLGGDFFENFGSLAERTVWVTDGCLDVCGSHEVYFSRLARQLAPVRLTGNYGSEILRDVTTFKYAEPPPGLFHDELGRSLGEAKASLAEARATHPVSFAAFRDIPWHLFGRLAAAESQMIVRSPYMDNDLVALMYQAPSQVRKTSELMLRLIAAMNPALSRIGTDMGRGGVDSRALAYRRRLHRYALFKAEWYYNAGMPDWFCRFDKSFVAKGLRRMFVGSHKIEHYRLWFREELSDWVDSMLADRITATRSYLDRRGYNNLVSSHRAGTRNCMNEINRVLTLELIQRLLVQRDYGSIPSTTFTLEGGTGSEMSRLRIGA